MNENSTSRQRERLLELIADERIGHISPEERAELESLAEMVPAETGESAEEIGSRMDDVIGRVIIALDALDESPGMPMGFKKHLAERGARLTHTGGPIRFPGAQPAGIPGRRPFAWLIAAASLVLLVVGGFYAAREIERREQRIAQMRTQAEARIAENEHLLAEAHARLESVTGRYSELETSNLDLVTRLADATSALNEARQKITMYETPEDPATLAERRKQLLDLSGTIHIGWKLFEVAGLPDAEQPGVSGDVVWNDDLQLGYMRFDGLAVNDPKKEQYQVWVIDERGMEQKVSGGVFNATKAGEIIVPIHPGIDVGRVQLFAVTVENAGGTWVPDLKRRVVVAPKAGNG